LVWGRYLSAASSVGAGFMATSVPVVFNGSCRLLDHITYKPKFAAGDRLKFFYEQVEVFDDGLRSDTIPVIGIRTILFLHRF